MSVRTIRHSFTLALVLIGVMVGEAADRTNVLFIAADDLRCDLGCYGHPLAITPHLDKLAARGTRFDRAYCAQALCNPSRSSLMTGRRPDTLRLYNLTKHFRDGMPDVVTLPEHFKNQGYFTQNIGKIYHNWRTSEKGDPRSWSVPAVMHYDSHRRDTPQVEGELPRNFASAIRCECRDVPDNAYFDGRITDLSLTALRERAESDQPFFLAVGFWKPHLPFNAPKKYWDMYDREAMLAPECDHWPTDTPRIAWHNSQELWGKKPAPLSDADARELRHGYLAAITYMDAQVGRLLNELDRLGLTDDTLVVFWSDHGFQLGDHTLWCKTSNFELDARVPMIIAPPKKPATASSEALVELLDLYPTIVDLCQVPTIDGPEGVSLRPLMEGQVVSVKDAALTQHPRPAYYNDMEAMGHSVRTTRFRYTEWRDPKDNRLVGVELYDHQSDPAETKNVAADKTYTSFLPSLRATLNELRGPFTDVALPESAQ
ncbi:sulfatase [Roseiconus lacunae]|uniref:Sulfatase n=1 Tax=Roseiconus lacunae TaxID=2605694 RepID=A0ABT7PPU9_9BACT|nr:sulfatase [Roseiconus lacunae]MDM4018524.1 sulfatase [Roseiconus lacunae]WRQ49044.1 sulfatase [Stieleria sp. HD01]